MLFCNFIVTNFHYGYSFTRRNVFVTDKSFQIVERILKSNKTVPFRFTFGTNNLELKINAAILIIPTLLLPLKYWGLLYPIYVQGDFYLLFKEWVFLENFRKFLRKN
jgi:hypothetical protein